MNDEQYTTLLSMIGGLTTAVARLTATVGTLSKDLTDLRQEMRDGFAAVYESHQQILVAIGAQVEPLQLSAENHEKRIVQLEQHLT